jgi:amidase
LVGITAACAAAATRGFGQTATPAPAPSAGGKGYRTAGELLADLAARRVSSVELLDQTIARIEALDNSINSVVVRDFDRARQAAIAADQALARGERRPLLGLPMTVKESFNVAGLPTTWGIPAFKDWRPTEDAVPVQRLKAAGAVIIGKTNAPVALADWQTTNPIYGTTNNPYDIERTPGGSSGGAAAALAAGYVALELGSDIGGSLRTPAHYCGVYAHKPTYGVVARRGHNFPRQPALPSAGDGLAVVGPMARSAQDIALEFGVIAGPDEQRDGVGWRLALPQPRHRALRDFRVLLIDTHPLCPTAESIRTAMARLADRLGKEGATVARQSPLLPDLVEVTRNYMRLLGPVMTNGRPPEFYEQMRSLAATLGATSAAPLWAGASGKLRTSFAPGCNISGRCCSRNGTSCSARRCRRRPSSTIVPSRAPAASTSMARPCPTTTISSGRLPPPLPGCRRPWRRSGERTAGCRSACRSSGPISRT